jgi:DNA-binding HxlR family transcriptional regulator
MPSDSTDEWQRTWHHLQRALGNKWALHVLHVVADGGCTFSELERTIDGIPETMVARRLSDLQDAGFVRQVTRAESPPRKEYRLTAAGDRVASFLNEMDTIASVADGGDGPRLVFETGP